MDIDVFVNMTARAWALPILAAIHNGVVGRQAPLLAATGASRTAFAQSTARLIETGLLERNPGHGHPLRPEFRLTPQGVIAAGVASRIHNATRHDDQDLLRRAWTLPVLTSLHRTTHFGEIRNALAPITDRALSQSLKTLETRNWVQRRVITDARPPRPVYRAINTGHIISQIAAQDVSFPPP